MKSLYFTLGQEDYKTIELELDPDINCCKGTKIFKISNEKQAFSLQIKYINVFLNKEVTIDENETLPSFVKKAKLIINYNGDELEDCRETTNLIVFQNHQCQDKQDYIETLEFPVFISSPKYDNFIIEKIESSKEIENRFFKIFFNKQASISTYDIRVLDQNEDVVFQDRVTINNNLCAYYILKGEDIPYSDNPYKIEIYYHNYDLQLIFNNNPSYILNKGNICDGSNIELEINLIETTKIENGYRHRIEVNENIEDWEYVLWHKNEEGRYVYYKYETLDSNTFYVDSKNNEIIEIYLERICDYWESHPINSLILSNALTLENVVTEEYECYEVEDVEVECKGEDFILLSYVNKNIRGKVICSYYETDDPEKSRISTHYNKDNTNQLCRSKKKGKFYLMIYKDVNDDNLNLKSNTNYTIKLKSDIKEDCPYSIPITVKTKK